MKDYLSRWWLAPTVLVLIAVASFIFHPPTIPASEVLREKLLEWKKALVLLNYHNQAQTSGFFVSGDGIIVCPYHLIQGWIIFADGYHIYAVSHEKKVFKADILAYDSDKDFLILKINYKPEKWFDEFESAQEFQECVVMGFPYGWRVGLQARIIEHPRFELMGADTQPLEGASGSVILSEEGKVLGMLVKRLGESVVVPSILIKFGLKKLKEDSQ